MRTALIVVELPHLDDGLRLGESDELEDVQALVPQASVTRFNEGIVHGFAGPKKVELQALPMGPIFRRP